MVIGSGSLFVIALGAIIAFGVTDQQVGPLNLSVIGWILMAVGLLGLILTLYQWNSRRVRRTVIAPPSQADTLQATASDGVVEERYTQRRY